MTVFLFPGQGSQEVGMGADLFRSDPAFRDLVALASDLVGEDLARLCLRGPEQQLVRTRRLQPLLVAVSLGYLRHLIERGVQPDLVLGHSLGEISALAAAGVVKPSEAVRIAARRGALMEEAVAGLDGAMLAVTLDDRTRVLEWLASAGAEARVVLANDNAPTQIVLSGERSALTTCAAFIARERLGQCRMLEVSGPWHSPFMADAAARFGAWLQSLSFNPPRVPILLDGQPASPTPPSGSGPPAPDLRARIGQALATPVRWRACMAALKALNPRLLLEVGPGRVLSGLARANGLGEPIQVLPVGNLRGVDGAARAAALAALYTDFSSA